MTSIASLVAFDNAYYDLLEVQVDASEADLKKAYKKQALKNHPDKNPDDPAATDRFQAITQAYEILIDPNARAHYDRYGTDGVKSQYGNGGPSFDADDIFASMFEDSFEFSGNSSGSGNRSRGTSAPRRPPATEVEYVLSLEEAFNGKRVVMGLERDRTCSHCHGSGAKSGATPRPCYNCEGRGTVMVQRQIGPGLMAKTMADCATCHGEGRRFRDKDLCKRCKGRRVNKAKAKIELEIKPGTIDGDRMVLIGEGDEVPNAPPADINFTFKLTPHASIKTGPSGSRDLYYTATINLSEALFGFSRILLFHLDGKGIHVRSEKGERVIQHRDVFRLVGLGMTGKPHHQRDGDMLIRVYVEMPSKEWARNQASERSLSLPERKSDMRREGDAVSLPMKLQSCSPGSYDASRFDGQGRSYSQPHGGPSSYTSTGSGSGGRSGGAGRPPTQCTQQ